MNDTIYTVSEITGEIRNTLENNFRQITVQGEISNFTRHSSGHRYFSMKDEGAQISCVMWRTRNVSIPVQDGMKVIATGNISVYPQRGNYQLDCISLRPLGQGDLYLAYEALKKKLSIAGYFDEERKKPLPRIPLKIGIATSPTSAALQDMKTTISRRFPLCEIILRPTLCQGDGSAEDIAEAIYQFQKSDVDVLIIGRGGGSIEDLWSFNTEIVAEAIYKSAIPIISAVGHETDFTISDFVSDVRAATPTAAAEIVTPYTTSSFLDYMEQAYESMHESIDYKIKDYQSKVDLFISSYGIRRFIDLVRNKQQFIDDLDTRRTAAITRQTKRFRSELDSKSAHLLSLNPLNPLNKGFALLRDLNGKFIGSDIILNQGELIAVERKNDILTTEIKTKKEKL